ncbi:unnamed protein product, partial [Trichogramma brassicae]
MVSLESLNSRLLNQLSHGPSQSSSSCQCQHQIGINLVVNRRAGMFEKFLETMMNQPAM